MLYKVKGMELVTVDTEEPVYLKWLNSGARISRIYPERSGWVSDMTDSWMAPYPLVESPKRLSIEELKQAGVQGLTLHQVSPRMVITNDEVDVPKVTNIFGKFANWCNDIKMPFNITVSSPWVKSIPQNIHYNMPNLMWREAGYADDWVTARRDEFWEIQKDINWKFFTGRLPQTKELYLELFEEMARVSLGLEYLGYFAPWNEPCIHTHKQQNETEAKEIGIGYRDFTEEVIDRIRAVTGEDTLVFWDKVYIGYDGGTKIYDRDGNLMHKKVRRSNVVYEVHKYYAPSNNYDVDEMVRQFKQHYDYSVNVWGVPVYLGEWSVNDIEHNYELRPVDVKFRAVRDAWRNDPELEYVVGDELYCLNRFYDQYGWTWDNTEQYKWWTETETQWVLDNIFDDAPNGGSEMSFNYVNDTPEELIIYRRKVVITDELIGKVPSGGTIKIELGQDEELVTKQ